jgi:hypothetical protein
MTTSALICVASLAQSLSIIIDSFLLTFVVYKAVLCVESDNDLQHIRGAFKLQIIHLKSTKYSEKINIVTL